MSQHLSLALLCLILATPLHGQSTAATSIPNLILVSGNLLKDCRGTIDHAAANGASLQSEFHGDPLQGGWGFHYILEFKQFPEARVFPPEMIAKNREQMRANLKYAAEKGVKIYLSHYNFCAPRPFVDAHREVNLQPKPRALGANWTLTEEEEEVSRVYGDLCWQNPLYRRFMVFCWTELFETYPELAGLILSIGEFNNCPDERSGDAYIERARSFCSVFDETLRKLGKTPILRTRGLQRQQLIRRAGKDVLAYSFLPVGPACMMRFSLDNNVTEEPDEEFDQWRKQGYDLWAETTSRGMNIGPFSYTNPRFMHAQIASLVRRNVQGLRISMSDPGGTHSPLLRLNQEALVRYAHKFEPYDEQHWIGRIAALVGQEEAASVLHACEDASAVVLGVPRVIGSPDDGLNLGAFQHFPPVTGSSPTLGMDTPNPPGEWRRGIISFRDILKACAIDGYTEGIVDRVAAGRPTPFGLLEGCIAKTERGAKTLEDVRARLLAAGKTPAADHLTELANCSKAAAMWGRYWNELLRARLAYEGVLRADAESLREKCAAECRQHYDAAVAMVEQVVELTKDAGSLNDALNMRREQRVQVWEKLGQAVKEQPKRPPAIPVGAQVLLNPRFQHGQAEAWDSSVIEGEASFSHVTSREIAVSILSDDPNARAAWSQSVDGNFRQGRYRLHATYRLEDVRGNGQGALIRINARHENETGGRQTTIELGKGMSPHWQTLDRELSFDDQTVALDVGLFLWLSSGKLSFQEVSLTRVQ